MTNLISYWTFDEASGGSLDSHGSNDGTITETVTEGSSGIIVDSYTFGGGHVNYGTPASLDMSGWSAFSVSVWVYYDGSGSDEHTAMSSWGTAGSVTNTASVLFRIEPSDDSVEGFVRVEPNTTVGGTFTGVSVTVNTWTHLVFVFTSTSLRLWVNNSEASNNFSTSANMDATASVALWVGDTDHTGATPDDSFTGRVDEVGVWDKTLSTAEISLLYGSGSGSAYPFASLDMQINVSDVWKSVEGIQINIGDAWKTVDGVQVNIGDAWKTVY